MNTFVEREQKQNEFVSSPVPPFSSENSGGAVPQTRKSQHKHTLAFSPKIESTPIFVKYLPIILIQVEEQA